MKNFNIFLIVFIFSSLLFINKGIAQDETIELKNHPRLDTFNLNEYVLPELEYKALEFGLNMNSNTSHQLTQGNKNYFHFISNINVNKSSFVNKPKLQRWSTYLFNIGGKYNSYNLKKDNKKAFEKNFNSNFEVFENLRFYHKPKRFFGLSVRGDFGYNMTYNKNTIQNFDYKYLYSGIKIGLSIGFGRKEDITDAWNTIRILKDFARLNLLKKSPSDNEIKELANTIAKSRYTRIFDYRQKRIESLKKIDSKLDELGLITNHDISYFTSLSDTWSNYTDRRYTGSIFSIGLVPNLYISKNLRRYFETSLNYGLGFKIDYAYHKALNMFWQLDIISTIEGSYQFNTFDIRFNYETIQLSPNFNIGVSYYPSTRTTFKSNLDILYYDNIEVVDNSLDFSLFKTVWSNKMIYYISPMASIDFNLSILYGSRNFGDINTALPIFGLNNQYGFEYYSKGLNYNTTLRFKYTIF